MDSLKSEAAMRMLLLAAMLSLPAADAVPLVRYDRPVRLADLQDPRIAESSGLCPSARKAGVLWTLNDSGNEPLLFAIDLEGQTRGVFRPAGARNVDWEDLASCTLNGVPMLVVADVGDNQRRRPSLTLYLVPEPDLAADRDAATAATIPGVQALAFTYEDAPHDCEAVAVDGEHRKAYLLVKELLGEAAIYELDLSAPRARPGTAIRVASVPVPLATGMSISPDNRRCIVITYRDAFEFYRMNDELWPDAFRRPPRRLPMPPRQQGESICYAADDSGLYLTSEKRPAPLWKVPVIWR
jgi:hypothetical protein